VRIEHLYPGWWCLRYIILAQMLLSVSVVSASDARPFCELAKENILSRSSFGLFQVSNLGSIRIRCRVPQRPFPTKPGEFRNGLRAETTAYEIWANGTKSLVASEVNVIGGGFGPDSEPEWVDFYVKIPLEADQLDTEVSRYLAKLERSMTPEQKEQYKELARKKARENLGQLVNQHRIGQFQVECRGLDGTRVMGVDVVELEVLFKGHFSDIGLPTSPPA
jgi:hypothetical protein